MICIGPTNTATSVAAGFPFFFWQMVISCFSLLRPRSSVLIFDYLQAWLEEYRTKLADVHGIKRESTEGTMEENANGQTNAIQLPTPEGTADLWLSQHLALPDINEDSFQVP